MPPMSLNWLQRSSSFKNFHIPETNFRLFSILGPRNQKGIVTQMTCPYGFQYNDSGCRICRCRKAAEMKNELIVPRQKFAGRDCEWSKGSSSYLFSTRLYLIKKFLWKIPNRKKMSSTLNQVEKRKVKCGKLVATCVSVTLDQMKTDLGRCYAHYWNANLWRIAKIQNILKELAVPFALTKIPIELRTECGTLWRFQKGFLFFSQRLKFNMPKSLTFPWTHFPRHARSNACKINAMSGSWTCFRNSFTLKIFNLRTDLGPMAGIEICPLTELSGEVWQPIQSGSPDKCFLCGCMASFVMCSYHICPPVTCDKPTRIEGKIMSLFMFSMKFLW